MQKLIVVDNFYADPEAVRALALRCAYEDVRDLNYPGFQSRNSFTSATLESSFASVVGQPLAIDPARLTFGKFRIMLASTGSRLRVHVDGESDWTGLIFLNTPDQACGGTAFYRHKATGLEGPPTAEHASALGFKSAADLDRLVVEPDTLNLDAWETVMFVAMKFNCLVLFRGNELFHSHTGSFGTDLENGRMTQNFFFDRAASLAQAPTG